MPDFGDRPDVGDALLAEHLFHFPEVGAHQFQNLFAGKSAGGRHGFVFAAESARKWFLHARMIRQLTDCLPTQRDTPINPAAKKAKVPASQPSKASANSAEMKKFLEIRDHARAKLLNARGVKLGEHPRYFNDVGGLVAFPAMRHGGQIGAVGLGENPV